MFDEKTQEQVVEETLEASDIQNVEKVSADNASTTTADNVAEIADYLNPELFNDVKTLSVSDLDENANSTDPSDEIEKNIISIYRSDSINATNLFDNEFFDWIYIDTDHSYETTCKELNSWSSKVKQEGVIAGHDYMMGNWLKTQRYGVIEAVHQFCVEDNWQIIYLTADQTENISFAIKRI